MARKIGSEMSEAAHKLLNLHNSERKNIVIPLLTPDELGYPRVCLLSPHQVIATERREFLLLVYEKSKTSANLLRVRKGTLIIGRPPAIEYINGVVELFDSSRAFPELGENLLFRMTIEEAIEDYSADAVITSNVTYDQTKILERYDRGFQEVLHILEGRK